MEDIAQAFLKRPGVILLVVLGFVGPTLGVSLWQTPVYEASAKLVVGQKPGVNQDYDLFIEPLQRILPTVAAAINQRPVAEEVIQRLGLQMKPAELVENLSVEQEGSTLFIQLSYKDADPERAQQIVNTVGVVSSERIPERSGSAYDVTVTMWEDASVPTTPAGPDPLRNAALALIVGLMVAPVLAILMSARGDVATSIGHSAHQIARSVGRTTSGTRGTPAGKPMTEAAKERGAEGARTTRGADSGGGGPRDLAYGGGG
jgi:capsular polysaccharide biosynthesis protein